MSELVDAIRACVAAGQEVRFSPDPSDHVEIKLQVVTRVDGPDGKASRWATLTVRPDELDIQADDAELALVEYLGVLSESVGQAGG